MLLQFTVGNFLSFKNPVMFSLTSSTIKEHEETHVFTVQNMRVLKSSVIYGANASGKSNLISAMKFIRWFVFNSSKESQNGEEIDVDQFRLSTETEGKPSTFEILFIHQGVRYRYGFEVNRTSVQSEWLFYVPKVREVRLFVREGKDITLGTQFKEGKGLQNKTRTNALFLSVVAQFDGEISNQILDWFRNLNVVSGLRNGTIPLLVESLRSDSDKKRIMEFAKLADLGIEDLQVETKSITPELLEDFPDELRDLILSQGDSFAFRLNSQHSKYDEYLNLHSLETFDFQANESEGTKKFMSLSAPLIDTLENGKVLVVDELDAKLHPLITRFIINLFHSQQTNPRNAQLIFATHDTNLLNNQFFRRDQIWFTEKNRYGCTDLYSLVEYKVAKDKVRNDASYAKDYILGKYGAIPYIGEFDFPGDDDGDGRPAQEEESSEKWRFKEEI